jgi:transcriptional regulator with XRE-family HTH domain
MVRGALFRQDHGGAVMKKPLPPRASLQAGIAALKAMPPGGIIQGPPGAFENATEFSVLELQNALSDAVLAENIGEMLRQARVKSGLTGTELAARLGLSKARVSQLERVGLDIEVSTLVRVADALGCELHLELVQRADRASREALEARQVPGFEQEAFDAALALVPDVEPLEEDRI